MILSPTSFHFFFHTYSHKLFLCGTLRVILFVLLLSFILLSAPISFAASKQENEPNLKYASIVIDADTGMVLSQENADRRLHPASLTKIITMVLVFDALDNKNITQKSRLVASSFGASMPPSKVGLKPKQSISVYDALRVLSTKSANDVAVTVAENLGGSETRFAQLMNLKARGIGMTGTNFVNASGLHDYRQISTARDMAKLAKYLIDTYPKYYPIFGISSHQYDGKRYNSHNKLMKTYYGMDGIKTGYVAASGFNLVASAKRGNTRLIGVVFGGRTSASRNSHMADLLDRGFEKINQIKTVGYYGDGRMTRVLPNTDLPPPKPLQKPLIFRNSQPTIQQVNTSPAADTPIISEQIGTAVETKIVETKIIESKIIEPNLPVPEEIPELAVTPSSHQMMKSLKITSLPLEETASSLPDKNSLKGLVLPEPKPDHMTSSMKSLAPVQQPVTVAADAANTATVSPRYTMAQEAVRHTQTPGLLTSTATIPDWQIQIGAFEDRTSTNKALYDAMAVLPKNLNKGKTLVIPLRTTDAKWVFRARLAGYTQSEALAACKHLKTKLKDCLPIAPQTR